MTVATALTLDALEPRISRFDDEAAWLGARRKGIGGSDAAAVLGEHPWKSPLSLYLEKRGHEDDDSVGEAAEWGKILEPKVRERWEQEAGMSVALLPHAMARSEEHDFLRYSPDGLILEDDGSTLWGVLEIKTASAFKASEWKDDVPLAYQIQVQHGLYVLGLERGSFGALIGGQKFVGPVEAVRNDRFIDGMVPRLVEFWQRVQAGEPPEPDWTKATTEALKQLYPKDTGESIALSTDALEWHWKRLSALEKKRDAEAEIAEADNHIKAELGEATYGVLPNDEGRYSWKHQSRKGYVVEPTEFRAFRHLKPKK